MPCACYYQLRHPQPTLTLSISVPLLFISFIKINIISIINQHQKYTLVWLFGLIVKMTVSIQFSYDYRRLFYLCCSGNLVEWGGAGDPFLKYIMSCCLERTHHMNLPMQLFLYYEYCLLIVTCHAQLLTNIKIKAMNI